jgi:hypothetical protein
MARKIVVKTSAEIGKKWKDVTPGRASFYETEATKAGAAWEGGTVGAGGNFKTAMASGTIGERYVGGAKKAGGAKYERKVKAVGVSRFGPGVEAAEADMISGMDPMVATLTGLSISDRGPRGSSGNYNIPKEVGDALHKKRLALLGASVSA